MSANRDSISPIQEFRKSLASLRTFLGAQSGTDDVEFTGVTLDSRDVRTGDLFLALPGAKVHGAAFVEDVKAKGAVAILTDAKGAEIVGDSLPFVVMDDPRKVVGLIAAWFYDAPFTSLGAVGITGTNGKTTTASLLDQIWRMDGRSSGFIGTIGITIDGEDFPTTFTTPEGTDLQSIVATMRERHVRNMVMEVSSHALELRRTAGARFIAAGFTNLTQDHLDFHGDMESYFKAKSKLFSHEYSDLGIINIDDPYGRRLYESKSIPMQSFSRKNRQADWYYEEAALGSSRIGYHVRIRGTGGILIEGFLPLVGAHNLDNALLSIALAVASGVDPIAIGYYMQNLAAPVGRLEPVKLGQNFLALVDYAHTPDAVEGALRTARELTSGRVIAVLGCGGDRDRRKRPIMGDALRAGSDISIFTSDNPRSEDPLEILREMVGTEPGEHESVIPDRREAIAYAIAQAERGDCVIVLGKGHEVGQEIKGVKHPFDDRIELARAIEWLNEPEGLNGAPETEIGGEN